VGIILYMSSRGVLMPFQVIPLCYPDYPWRSFGRRHVASSLSYRDVGPSPCASPPYLRLLISLITDASLFIFSVPPHGRNTGGCVRPYRGVGGSLHARTNRYASRPAHEPQQIWRRHAHRVRCPACVFIWVVLGSNTMGISWGKLPAARAPEVHRPRQRY
jgi:hypothetical protein